ncbi:D-glycerate dehydrogenase [Caldibacillus lycopersici]|uniref:Glyoxylate/hydroxypyruvate reductase B n=1 Tax=Perspicuibacillus lycopersici TaxID=1325689 RepID=A0AAE3LLV2_9BACI|nr:D-glycerate dehydrogenase [Perspicuibacillus lycopersici]MCU9612820.1 D-glycerate dehydrogenase [Perspicuibacillus lycopersici]
MSKRPYVYVTRKMPAKMINILESVAEVGMWESEETPVPREILLEEANKADGLFTVLADQIDEELFQAAPNLKVVANLAVGFDNIDVQAATKRGIAVCNTPDILTDTTADLAFSLVLMVGRRLAEAVECVKTGNWTSWSPFFMAGADVHHKTIGIVGMGSIGEAVAKRALGFQMNVIYHNRNRKIETEKALDVSYRSFEDLVVESDYIVCLTPLTDATKGMFSKEVFRKMKNTAYFINASRGTVVVEEDLVEALREGEIAGAGLDVFHQEPIDPNHPLLQFPNVVALPHIGSASVETRGAMIVHCCENIAAVLKGETPVSLVNKEIKC